eukprot:scaffold132967_cov39-Phaeocystis_antarctica.AAC.1
MAERNDIVRGLYSAAPVARGLEPRLKKIRSIAAPSGTVGAGDARVFSPTEKELIIEQAKKMAKVQVGSKPDCAGVARELQRLHPTLFGRGAPRMQDGGIRGGRSCGRS